MANKELVLVASRAIFLYLVVMSIFTLTGVPVLVFAVSHYTGAPLSAGQTYFYDYYLIELICRSAGSVGLFLAAVYAFKCGPTIERYLSPSGD